ncbi:MAG: Fe-S cluster assembly protein SufD [Nanoarchaeota archaeon]
MLNENTLRTIAENEPQWLIDNRLSSMKKFKELSLPKFKYGIGILVDTSELNLNINPLLKNETVIVADESVRISRLHDALENHGELIREIITKQPNDNKINALHNTFFNDFMLIHIPKNTKIEKPIQINNKINDCLIRHILIIAEDNSEAIITEHTISAANNQTFCSQFVNVIVKENAKLKYNIAQGLNTNAYNFLTRKANVGRNGKITWMTCSIGSKFNQSSTKTNLIAEGAESKTFNVAFGDREQCYDLNEENNHIASNTLSSLLAKLILNDKARIVFRGLVKINNKAEGCEGSQKEESILLSENARVDIVPNLEISNNNVKCNHGATISQIDEETLFYLMSRGIHENMAKKLIIEGIFDTFISKVDDENLKKEIKEAIAGRL